MAVIASGYSCDAMQAYNYDCHCACPDPSGLPPPEPNEGQKTCDTAAISAACSNNVAELLSGNLCTSTCTTTVIDNWDACTREIQDATHGGHAGGDWTETESLLESMGAVVQMCRGGGH